MPVIKAINATVNMGVATFTNNALSYKKHIDSIIKNIKLTTADIKNLIRNLGNQSVIFFSVAFILYNLLSPTKKYISEIKHPKTKPNVIRNGVYIFVMKKRAAPNGINISQLNKH